MDLDIRKSFEKISKLKVLVVGDIILDEYVDCEVERLSQEAPIPIFKKMSVSGPFLGGAANVAKICALLGARVEIGSVVGNCPNSYFARNELEANNVDTRWIYHLQQHGVTIKRRYKKGYTHLARVDEDVYVSPFPVRAIENASPDIILFSDYGKGVVTENVVNMGCLHAKTYCDPYPNKTPGTYRGSVAVVPNEHEYKSFDIWEGIASNFVLTTGKRGCEIVNLKSLPIGIEHVSPFKARELIDTCGCGDSFFAVFSLFHCVSGNIRASARIANLAGSLTAEKLGVYPVSQEDILEGAERYGLEIWN